MVKDTARIKKNHESESVEHQIEKSTEDTQPRCLAIAQKGVRTGSDFAMMMSGLMSDVIEGRVNPGTANAACNAGGKLLKVVEMQMKYATTTSGATKQLDLLAPSQDEIVD